MAVWVQNADPVLMEEWGLGEVESLSGSIVVAQYEDGERRAIEGDQLQRVWVYARQQRPAAQTRARDLARRHHVAVSLRERGGHILMVLPAHLPWDAEPTGALPSVPKPRAAYGAASAAASEDADEDDDDESGEPDFSELDAEQYADEVRWTQEVLRRKREKKAPPRVELSRWAELDEGGVQFVHPDPADEVDPESSVEQQALLHEAYDYAQSYADASDSGWFYPDSDPPEY